MEHYTKSGGVELFLTSDTCEEAVICLHKTVSDTGEHCKPRPKKKILCFGQPDPTYRNRSTLDFLNENTVFFSVGVFIIEVSILKKKQTKKTEPTVPKVFQTFALNTRFFFLGPRNTVFCGPL